MMDPGGDEQLDYGDEGYGGSQKMQYHGGGAISALVEDEMVGGDDEYDDLYNDVNVGEGFLQMQKQRSEASLPPVSMGNGGYQPPRSNNAPDPSRLEKVVVQGVNITGVVTEGKDASSSIPFPDQRSGLTSDTAVPPTVDASQKGRAPEMTHSSQAGNLGYQGSLAMSQQVGVSSLSMSAKVSGEPQPLLNPVAGGSRVIQQVPTNHVTSSGNVNIIHPVVTANQIRPAVENGNTMLFVGDLHWWTTDAELENVLTQYGKVKEIKFFDERASGKSKGYCQVEFADAAAAAACKEGMNGHVFNGRACVVASASPQTIKQMAASYMNKTQVQAQSQSQPQGKRPVNDSAGRGSGTSYLSGDAGRNFGRGGMGGRGGQGMPVKGPGGVSGRGRGAVGGRSMAGNAPGGGNGINGGGYGPGIVGPAFAGPPTGFMHPQAMMGPGFDPTYMGRGAGYGGFSGPAFPGMIPPFPAVNPMGLGGVAPHVNPAFFGRGMAANGMGMMGTAGMEGPHLGMWTDTSMGGWGGEEHGRRTRESSYGGEDNASEYGYGEASHDKGVRSSAASREKERGSERDWSGSSERRHCDEREQDRDRYDRDHRYREDKDNYREYRHKDRDPGNEDNWERGQPSRSRSRSRANPEEHHRSRSRDADYGKRRGLPSE